MKRYSFRLISEYKDGSIIGPMSPMLAAKQVAKALGDTPALAVYEVDFTEHSSKMYQEWEADGWTGAGQFVVCTANTVVFFIDKGCSIEVISFCCGTDADDASMKGESDYKYKLTDDEAIQLVRDAYELAQAYKPVLRNLHAHYKAQHSPQQYNDVAAIISAVDKGTAVFWKGENYKVVKGKDGYLIRCDNGHCIGLTWQDRVTLNGHSKDFYSLLPEDVAKVN